MKPSLKSTLGITVAIVGSMIWTQVAHSQSGNRSTVIPFQQTTPQQLPPSAGVETYGSFQGSGQRSQTSPTTSQRPAIPRIGFEQYDHRSWDALLQKYVDQNGDVDYASWQTNPQDRAILLNYLQGMNSIDSSLNSSIESQMAFWINAYNALTVEGILQLYPTRSIKDHAPDANGFNIWDDFKMPVGGAEYSLNEIEHNILRKLGDPRIHFAIVCASKSCPQLSQRAYFPSTLDQHLNYSSSLFFHTPGKFSYDAPRGSIGLSPIIDWFGEDFGGNDQARLQYLSQFMPADAARLATSGSATISYLEYDWGLNEVQNRNLTAGANLGSAQAIGPQGSTTRQSAPDQDLFSQGFETRQRTDAFRPVQPQSRFQNSCGNQFN